MIDRRGWLGSALAGGLAIAAGGLGGRASAQEPKPQTKGRRTVRRPVTARDRTAMRPVLEPWETGLASDPRIETILAPMVETYKPPGMIGAILKGTAITAIGAVGIRKIGSSDPIRVTDQIHIGSCTKAMTATMIGTLFEDQLLAPSTTISELFPDDAPGLHPDFQKVTLWQLLTHRAGLPHDASWWTLAGQTTTEQRRSAMLQLMSKPPLTKPGTTYAYSNAGYALAGLMAEQATGQPWEDLMQERLFAPLNMFSAGFGPPGAGRPGTVDQPFGHHMVRGRLEATRHDNAACLGPAGTVHCTTADWAKFAIAHLRGERADGKLLRAETFRELHTAPKGSQYAAGWIVVNRPWAGGRALTHSGSNTYWYCTIWLAPARDFGILVAANRGDGDVARACDEAVGALIGLA
ncbi:MAG: serine hydrolase [Paludisphaera borealis]|uniref:serine hydrolase domain-containing protein n=1 Tax=Paludisphaera borealis TaxID=1387353 RepID=UPI00284D2021|nr:serine hydrolase domain-containing protein [Paludisphaera borealis]MDR3619777.1 serine hydrolase [Paludisphaera borealis]